MTVTPITTDETPQRFRGSYVLVLRRVQGSTSEQRKRHLYSANITRVN